MCIYLSGENAMAFSWNSCQIYMNSTMINLYRQENKGGGNIFRYFFWFSQFLCKQNFIRGGMEKETAKLSEEKKEKKWYIDFCSCWQHNIFGWTFATFVCGFGEFFSYFSSKLRRRCWATAKQWTVGKHDLTADNVQIIYIFRLIWQNVYVCFFGWENFWCYSRRWCANNDTTGIQSILLFQH